MRFLTALTFAFLWNGLFFFTIPEGNVLEIGIIGIIFSFFFGMLFSIPILLFFTLPSVMISHAITSKMDKFQNSIRLVLYVVFSVILYLFYTKLGYLPPMAGGYVSYPSLIFISFGYSIGYSIGEFIYDWRNKKSTECSHSM